MRSKKNICIPPELVRVSESCCSSYSDGYTYEYDMCYWRKCWNIRRAIGLALDTDVAFDTSKTGLDIDDVKNIWHALNYLNHKHVWEEGDSIWSYKEMRNNLNDSLLTLEWLISFMRKHQREFRNEDICIEFYDSY